MLNAAVFYYDYTDYQIYEYIPDPTTFSGFLWQWGNVPELSYKGFEVEILAIPSEKRRITGRSTRVWIIRTTTAAWA
jgi:hypothetical protein